MFQQDSGGSGVYPNKCNSFKVIQNNVALCAYELLGVLGCRPMHAARYMRRLR